MSLPKFSNFWICIVMVLLGSVARAGQYGGETVDRGDGYVLGDGTTVTLLRAKQEIAVRFKEAFSTEEATRRLHEITADTSAEWSTSFDSPGNNRVDLVRVADSDNAAIALQGAADVALVMPVLIDPQDHSRVVATDEIIVALQNDADIAAIAETLASDGLELIESWGLPEQVFMFRVTDPAQTNVFAAALAAGKQPGVIFAEPNFYREITFDPPPNPGGGFIPGGGGSEIFETVFNDGEVVALGSGAPPTPTVTLSGGKNLRTNSASITLAGKAYGGVRAVKYRVGSGSWKTALGKASWSFELEKLKRGRNVVTIIAIGPRGSSPAIKATIIRK